LNGRGTNAVGQLATPRKTAFCFAVGRLFQANPIV
jgi:hypothetical protein